MSSSIDLERQRAFIDGTNKGSTEDELPLEFSYLSDVLFFT